MNSVASQVELVSVETNAASPLGLICFLRQRPTMSAHVTICESRFSKQQSIDANPRESYNPMQSSCRLNRK